MSSGAIFALGFVAGVLLTSAVFVSARSRLRQPLPAAELVTQVSEETMARARELVAHDKVILAVKVIRDETGWDLKRVKAVVDTLPRNREKDDGPYYLG